MAFTMTSQGYFSPSVNSPDIAKDGSVTFKVKAASADTVRLIIDSRLDTLMKLTGNETWSITLRDLEPDLYMYFFTVDGMKVLDTENAQVLRDVKSVMNTFVLDPKGDCPMAVHDVPHGEVRAVWYDSPTLGTTRRMMIYLPLAMSRAVNATPCSICCTDRAVTRRYGLSRAAPPKCSTTSLPAARPNP